MTYLAAAVSPLVLLLTAGIRKPACACRVTNGAMKYLAAWSMSGNRELLDGWRSPHNRSVSGQVAHPVVEAGPSPVFLRIDE